MAVISTRATAATVNTLITRVRRYIGDTDTDTNNQRWSDADIRAAMDDMLASMYVELSNNDPSAYMTSADLTYTGNALSIALPSGIEAHSIYKIEDVTDGDNPIYLSYRNPIEINRFDDQNGWTFYGPATDSSGTATNGIASIALRPVPTSNKTLRIYCLATFIPLSNATPSTDQHAFPINHEELIVIGASIRLQEVDNEIPPTRMARYTMLWEQFQKAASRYTGPIYVRDTRILLN